jgi:hypothetical protein
MTIMDHPAPGRRESDKLTVIDTDGALTIEELEDLKQLAGYWKGGRLAAGVILGLGAIATAVVFMYDRFAKWVH